MQSVFNCSLRCIMTIKMNRSKDAIVSSVVWVPVKVSAVSVCGGQCSRSISDQIKRTFSQKLRKIFFSEISKSKKSGSHVVKKKKREHLLRFFICRTPPIALQQSPQLLEVPFCKHQIAASKPYLNIKFSNKTKFIFAIF